MAPHGCYRCRGEDGWVAIAVADDRQWQAFCEALGKPAWTQQEKFSDELSRWHHQDELDRHIEEWTRQHDAYEIADRLQKADIAASPSLSTKQFFEDRHIQEREFFVQCDHPLMGRISIASVPWRMSDSPRGNYTHPPLLGEHNDYVFGTLLGLSKEQMERLRAEKVFL
jgi:benzylsuccinate CoA-transferase BbsF subunit